MNLWFVQGEPRPRPKSAGIGSSPHNTVKNKLWRLMNEWVNEWSCAHKWSVSFTLFHDKMLVLDKIFTKVNIATLVHMRRYNKHKMKVPRRGFRKTTQMSFTKLSSNCLDLSLFYQLVLCQTNYYSAELISLPPPSTSRNANGIICIGEKVILQPRSVCLGIYSMRVEKVSGGISPSLSLFFMCVCIPYNLWKTHIHTQRFTEMYCRSGWDLLSKNGQRGGGGEGEETKDW